jgi:GNAT superfamily N-acetyltransferase
MKELDVRPVTGDNWEDFVRLFRAKSSPHYCWCSLYRVAGNREPSHAQKKAVMWRLVSAGCPVGVLAYQAGDPVGWCSVAPRESYACLERSRAMPRLTPPGSATWTVLCFFVTRLRRGQRIAHDLLEGAVRYAREQDAELIEGYPFDTAGNGAAHRGHSRTFEATGFQRDGNRWFRHLQP